MSKKKHVSLKDSLKIALWSLSISWRISRFATVTTFITTTYKNLRPLVNTYIVSRIIDSLIQLIERGEQDIELIFPMIGLLGVVELVNIITSNLDVYANRIRNRLSNSFLMQIEYEKVNSLGVQTNQLPSVSNKRKIAEDWIYGLTDINLNVVRIFASIVQSILAGIIVFSFSFWIGIAVLCIAVISYFQSRYYFRRDFRWQTNDKNTQERRKTWYMSDALSSPDKMDEVSLVGAYHYLDRKIKTFYSYFNSGFINIIKARTVTSFLVDFLNLFVVLGGSVQVFLMAFSKKITIGQTTFYISTINNFYGGISWFSSELVLFSDLVMKGKEVYDFFNLQPVVQDGSTKLERLTKPPMIEIKNISFHYPNSKVNIFENFSLTINSGEKIAIVGENGAGKSTLVKLLCRIYDPQKGKILINGIDLKDLTLNDWYKNVGVLFQDFNFYGSLSVEENIFIGKSVKKLDRKRVVESAKNADAHDFIMKYKRKYQTVMNDQFKGGIKPSKGQQQKIAIARFFYRDAPFAIFDEPTSAIDADAEYRIFNRIYNFFDNKTVMIISHRFSTVRNADRIYVVRNGKIIERGTHQELIQRKGVYADNFRKQAEGYN